MDFDLFATTTYYSLLSVLTLHQNNENEEKNFDNFYYRIINLTRNRKRKSWLKIQAVNLMKSSPKSAVMVSFSIPQ